MRFAAYRIIGPAATLDNPSAAIVLDTPELVARAEGTCVVPFEKQHNQEH
jgi:3-aminobutyryl-CoA ammonia-lyase